MGWIKNAHTFLDRGDDLFLGFDESRFQLISPLKWRFGAEKVFKWPHQLTQLTIGSHLVDEAKVAAGVSDVIGTREVTDGLHNIRKRFHTRGRYY